MIGILTQVSVDPQPNQNPVAPPPLLPTEPVITPAPTATLEPITGATNVLVVPQARGGSWSAVQHKSHVVSLVAGSIVVLAVATGAIIILTRTAKKVKTVEQAAGQTLSDADLQKLSANSISYNTANAAVTFHAPVSFDKDLKVSGQTTVTDLAINGVFSPDKLNVKQVLQVGGATSLQGDLTTKGQITDGGNLSVGGNATFNGNATFSGALAANSLSVKTANVGGLTFGHILTSGTNPLAALGNEAGSGSVRVTGNDTSGTVVINTGSGVRTGEFATITFRTPFGSTPHVILTPVGIDSAGAQYYVTRSVNSFTIGIKNPNPSPISYVFDYLVTQ